MQTTESKKPKARNLTNKQKSLLYSIANDKAKAREYKDNDGKILHKPRIAGDLVEFGFLRKTEQSAAPKRGHFLELTDRAIQSLQDSQT